MEMQRCGNRADLCGVQGPSYKARVVHVAFEPYSSSETLRLEWDNDAFDVLLGCAVGGRCR